MEKHRIGTASPRPRKLLSVCAIIISVATLNGIGCSYNPFWKSPPPVTLDGTIIDPPVPPSDEVVGTSEALSFTARPAFCCSPLRIEFAAVLGEAQSSAGVHFLWSFGDGRTEAGPNVEHDYPWAGAYIVELTAELPNGEVLVVVQQLQLVIDGFGSSQIIVAPAPEGSGGDDEFPTSSPPALIADAGPDLAVESGQLVILDGSNSQLVTIDPARFQWTQIEGPSVQLNTDDQPVVSFVAPDVGDTTAVFGFMLSLTQGMLHDEDEVRITVNPGIFGMEDETAPPVAFDLNASTVLNEPVLIELLAVDPNGEDLDFSIVDEPLYGTLGPVDNSARDSATVLYMPNLNYVGTDLFTFNAYDGIEFSNVAAVHITVFADARAPEARGSETLGRLNTPVYVQLSGIDPDEDPLSFEILQSPVNGTLGPMEVLSSSSARIRYTPNSGFQGEDNFYFRVSDGVYESPPGAASVFVMKAILPWTEINLPTYPALEVYPGTPGVTPDMTLADFCVAGLHSWADVTDQAVVTTVLGLEDYLYPDLLANGPPGMKIIGGFKTAGIMPGSAPYSPSTYSFTDANAWQLVAEGAQRIVELTGVNIVVLENETGLHPFYIDVEDIDYQAMEQALLPLHQTGIEFWWWLPEVSRDIPEFPNANAETVAFVAAIGNALPNCKFLTQYAAWYWWEETDEGVLRQQMMNILGADGIQEGLYVTPTGEWYYPGYAVRCYTATEAIPEAVDLPGNTVRFYSPGENWMAVAQDFEELLPTLGQLVD